MKVFKRVKREGLFDYCDKVPLPLIVVDSDYNVVLMNRRAEEKFPSVKRFAKCYELTHGLEKPCWELRGDVACPVKRLQEGEEPYAYHEHEDKNFHILVAEKLDDSLFMEIYLDTYISDLIRELRFLADTDSLTGFYNRRKIEEILAKEIDTYGHKSGDEVLRRIAEIIKSELRRTDYVGRFGGEEFMVVLP